MQINHKLKYKTVMHDIDEVFKIQQSTLQQSKFFLLKLI